MPLSPSRGVRRLEEQLIVKKVKRDILEVGGGEIHDWRIKSELFENTTYLVHQNIDSKRALISYIPMYYLRHS